MGPVARPGLAAAAIAAGYFACIVLSMLLRFAPDGWALVWPARGFLLAVLMVLPPRRWWLLAAIVPVHFAVTALLLPEAPPLAAGVQLLGHLAVALASALAIRWLATAKRPFDTAASLSLFIAVAGIAIPAAVNLAVIGLQVGLRFTVQLFRSLARLLPPLVVSVVALSVACFGLAVAVAR